MERNIKTRYIKTVIFNSINDISNIESKVNETINYIKEQGGKVISIFSQNWGVSPMNLIYNIVYEHDCELKNPKGDKPNEKQ